MRVFIDYCEEIDKIRIKWHEHIVMMCTIFVFM